MASLLITREGEPAQRFLLSEHKLVSVGRDDQCTLQVLDEEVSRRHLQVRHDLEADRHVAVDARSANGVFINGHRIIKDVPLRDGDCIRIGHTTLVYLTQDDVDAETALAALRKKDEWKRSTRLPE